MSVVSIFSLIKSKLAKALADVKLLNFKPMRMGFVAMSGGMPLNVLYAGDYSPALEYINLAANAAYPRDIDLMVIVPRGKGTLRIV